MTQHGEVGLRGVLHAHNDDVLEVAIDSDEVLADIDTPDDYARALQRLEDRR
jgi:CTP:molybdopterin cytidylyltransferase MocA